MEGAASKGENLATHEDIAKLNNQMRTLTTTAETIKDEISDAVWNRQRRADLKREVLFEAAKRLAEVDKASEGVSAAHIGVWRFEVFVRNTTATCLAQLTSVLWRCCV